jgi:RND family efflux transporter MFP subunit
MLVMLLARPAAGADLASRELECLVEPKESVVVSAATVGVVDRVLVDRGDRVAVGQLVATLESSVEQRSRASARARAAATAELDAARISYELAVKQFERTRQLFDEGVASDVDLDEARAERELKRHELEFATERQQVARLDLERADAAVELRKIHSPVDGVVVKRLRGRGEYADPPELLEIAQIDPLHVEVFAPANLLGQIGRGMVGRVRFEQPIGGTHEATVTVVDPVVDPASGTFGVRLELPNPDRALPAGLKCWVGFDPEATPSAVDPTPPPEDPGDASAPASVAPGPSAPTVPVSSAPPRQRSAATVVFGTGEASRPGARVQLLSAQSVLAIERGRAELAREHPDLLDEHSYRIVRADLGERGVYYRLRLPVETEEAAGALCEALKARSVDCLVLSGAASD